MGPAKVADLDDLGSSPGHPPKNIPQGMYKSDRMRYDWYIPSNNNNEGAPHVY